MGVQDAKTDAVGKCSGCLHLHKQKRRRRADHQHTTAPAPHNSGCWSWCRIAAGGSGVPEDGSCRAQAFSNGVVQHSEESPAEDGASEESMIAIANAKRAIVASVGIG